MSKKALVTELDTSNNVAVYRETLRQRGRTLRIPSELNPIEVQEWNRLVAERQGQPDGILSGDAPFFKAAAWTFGRIVLMRSRLVGLSARRAYDIYIPRAIRTYIGICHSLGCTPAVPNRSQYARSKA